jgi:hypothetical protein
LLALYRQEQRATPAKGLRRRNDGGGGRCKQPANELAAALASRVPNQLLRKNGLE